MVSRVVWIKRFLFYENEYMDLTLKKGILTEIQAILDFTQQGYFCSIPYGDACRYDLIVDINNTLYKIQCKTSSWVTDTAKEKEAFKFECRTSTTNTKTITRRTYTKNEIDFFYTSFNGKSYLVPISEAEGKTSFRFRYEYPSSGQKQGIHLAEEYELEKQLQRLEEVVE